MIPRPASGPIAVVLVALSVSGCTVPGTLAGGGASVAVAVAQERTVGAALDDSVITIQINEALFKFNFDLLQAVGVEVVEGRVLLTGSVEKPEQRVDAVRLAWQVDGVKEVFNEIQVTDRGGLIDIALDTWISTQLRSKLLLDKDVLAINYNIETVNGIVYMIGIAQDENELARVTNHARTIENVRKVVSHVHLKDAPAG